MMRSLMRSGNPAKLLRNSSMAARAMSSGGVEFEVAPFKLHGLDSGPSTKVTSTREELLEFYTMMYRMRRMEITCDNEYKARNIRGFCHLYDGQEAVAMGIESALTHDDSWITSYRCHCMMLLRGGNVKQVLAELFGLEAGVVRGKGGSMHMYNKEHNFYGGQGIVGAQVPVGTGLAFSNKYLHNGEGLMPVAIGCYGDGASNQGQVYEAANMAKLWNLPMIFGIENNQYGMGTSIERSTANTEYYTSGNKIPGLWIDGMDVLAVKEGMKFAKEYCGGGNGPLFVEFSTYRYHGHSMSDPGVTYRNREEISQMRASRDPIEAVKKKLLDNDLATADELKKIEKDVRKEVQQATKEAKASKPADLQEAYTDIYADENGKSQYPTYIRTTDVTKSLINGQRQG